jgi:peptidoglycan/xylan/chitin deacetylase (PgdA/CDA1 family)
LSVQLGLKVDVDTLRGTQEGVPRLVDALARAGARATFLFSLGPDHTGRALRRVLRPGFLRKVSRTSVVRHYGLKSLLYGTLLPGPDIGRRAGEVMRRTRDQGFDVGVHCHDHILWQDFVTRRDPDWTARQMTLAADKFRLVFGVPPRVHGAAGWQMNPAAFELEERMGFAFASDTRGSGPFVPVIAGRPIGCPQLPTTLPTTDELLGRDGVDEDNFHLAILRLTAAPGAGQVFTLHAELEGLRLLSTFLKLLAGWREQGHELVDLSTLGRGLSVGMLPRCPVIEGTVPGRSGTLALQGESRAS